jgi:hypothetical protein
MFYKDRKDLMESIKIIKGDVCAYGQKEIGSLCDCKFRQNEKKHNPLNESFSGCAELSNVYVLLNSMTDREYERIMKRED